MILTSSYQWVQLYDKIKAESRKSTEKHVNIYVSAADTDSVCALRILESLLKNDLVDYFWSAVSRYQEVIEDFKTMYQEDDPVTRFVILINCGATQDIDELLSLAQRPNVCVVVIDSSRPIMHLYNDENPNSNLFALLDEQSEGLRRDDIPLAYDDGSDSEGEEEDSDQENDEGNARPRQRRRLSEDGAAAGNTGNRRGGGDALGPDDDADSHQGDAGEDSGDEDGLRELTRAPQDDPRTARILRRRDREIRRKERATYYLQGLNYGKPSACVMYDLAYEMNQDSSYLLWLALVGLTDHYVHNRITDAKYQAYYGFYEENVLARGHMDPIGHYEALDGEGTTSNAASVMCRIVPQDDFKFGLLREWSLWDAMVHSPYVSARLHTYTEKGRQKLELLMAKLGIPLREARSSFTYDMKPKFQQKLFESLTTVGAAFNLQDALFQSFQLQDGFNRCVMAVDAVHAVTALLESGAVRRTGDEVDGPRQDHVERFWRCWRALDWKDDQGELRKGLELAKKVQTALIRDGGSVVQQKLFHNFKQFKMFDLSDHKLGNHTLLVHPMALQRLAAFFQDQQMNNGINTRRKPIVLIGPKDALTGRCFVVGYQMARSGGGNRLADAFADTAETVNAQAWHDLFASSVMEIAHDDVERFKAELLRSMNDMF